MGIKEVHGLDSKAHTGYYMPLFPYSSQDPPLHKLTRFATHIEVLFLKLFWEKNKFNKFMGHMIFSKIFEIANLSFSMANLKQIFIVKNSEVVQQIKMKMYCVTFCKILANPH